MSQRKSKDCKSCKHETVEMKEAPCRNCFKWDMWTHKAGRYKGKEVIANGRRQMGRY